MSQVDSRSQTEALRRRVQNAMHILARRREHPDAADSKPGYFRIPVCRNGKRYDLPLGFLGTNGCAWARSGGCTICDYGGYDGHLDSNLLVKQANQLLDEWGTEFEIALSPLGSFFDDQELAPDARKLIMQAVRAKETIDLLSVETRPDTISRKKVREAVNVLGSSVTLEIGLGLESVNDFVRNVCINKCLTSRRFERSVQDIMESGAKACAHVLLKPPFVTEAESIDDAVASINYADSLGVRRIVLMVCNVKYGTVPHWLWERGRYRSPWLWSALETVRRAIPSAQRKLLVYGFRCGLPMLEMGHNCSHCTDTVLAKIEDFCASQDPDVVDEALQIGCECKAEWLRDLQSSNEMPLPDRVASFCDEFEAHQAATHE